MKRRSFLYENGLILLLFAMGLGALFYSPFVRAIVNVKLYNHSQRFLEEGLSFDQKTADERMAQYRAYNEEQAKKVQGYIDSSLDLSPDLLTADRSSLGASESIASKPQYRFDSNHEVFAVLTIPRLQLEYPIYLGATPEHLDVGLAVVRGSSLPVGGMNTHSVIAGHNDLIQGEFFSNIDQLMPGDDIYVKSPLQRLHYKVKGHDVIRPTDTDYLNVVEGHDRLSLLTCYSQNLVQNRLVVFADRVIKEPLAAKDPVSETRDKALDPMVEDEPKAWFIYAKPIVMGLGYIGLNILLTVILIYWKRRQKA